MTSVVGSSASVSREPCRGILPAVLLAGSKSQGAAAAITPSQPGRAASDAASISAVVTTGITFACVGYSIATGPLTIVTRWPRASAAAEIARAIRPLEALVR